MSVAIIISGGIGIISNGVSIYKSNQGIDHEKIKDFVFKWFN